MVGACCLSTEMVSVFLAPFGFSQIYIPFPLRELLSELQSVVLLGGQVFVLA